MKPRSSSVRSPIRVTAFVDWNAQIRTAGAEDVERPEVRAKRALDRTARVVVKVLVRTDPSARFRVGLRLYHGWYKGFEPTENRKAVVAVVAGTDFSDLSRSPNVSFSKDVRYGDDLLAAVPERRHVRPPIHLPGTLRRQERNSPFVEKMVDTALAADLLVWARNEPRAWAIVLSEDDDVAPPVFAAEAWTRPHGGRALIVRTRRGRQTFLKLGGLLEQVTP